MTLNVQRVIKEGATIENQLKQFRNASGFKQTESANHISVTVRQYQRLESQTPKSVIQFMQLAKLYNTDIGSLVGQGVDENQERNNRMNDLGRKGGG